MKFCKDCKHFVESKLSPTLALCQSREADPVYGTPKLQYVYIMRKDYHHIESCGPDGRWWEPKPVEPVKSFWQKIWG